MKFAFVASVCLLALSSAGEAATLYSNDFSTNTAGFGGSVEVFTTPTSEKYLGLHESTTAVFTLPVAAIAATDLSLTFDLYAIQSLDGNGEAGGAPDPFVVTTNLGQILFNYNVANYSGATQNYNGDRATSGPGYTYAARTGATANGTLGYGTGDFGDSIYRITLSVPTGTGSISFAGRSNQAVGDENYGIDNVVLTGTPAVGSVPEPATWAMMIGGFGMVGGAMRWRRRPHLARA